MSDNVIRPEQWRANAEASLEEVVAVDLQAEAIVGGGGGPHDPGMEALIARVDGLEADVKGLKETLGRIEPVLTRVDGRITQLAVDVAEMKGTIKGLPGTWAMIATVIGGQVALAGMLFGGIRFLTGH